MKKFLKWALVVSFAAAPAVWAASSAPSKEEAVAIVKKAVAALKTEGKDKVVSELNTKNGPFHQGELFAFAYDMTGTIIAHPVKKDVVGTNQYNEGDVDGKKFRKEIIDNAKAGKSGWVTYKYTDPASGKVGTKTTYYEPAGGVVIAAGIVQN